MVTTNKGDKENDESEERVVEPKEVVSGRGDGVVGRITYLLFTQMSFLEGGRGCVSHVCLAMTAKIPNQHTIIKFTSSRSYLF